MTVFSRDNPSLFGQWWWTVDRQTFISVVALMVVGLLAMFAVSPYMAESKLLSPYHFVGRHALFMLLAMGLMVMVSFMPLRHLQILAVGLLGVGIVLLMATLWVGSESKGARRWLALGLVNLQPVEIIKPAFVVCCAWVLVAKANSGGRISAAILAVIVGILAYQPDFGSIVLLAAVWASMVFMAGASWSFMLLLASFSLLGGGVAYSVMPHVASRIDRFLSPAHHDTYQVDKSMEAFRAGGFFGLGPGEGRVKAQLPDAHTDFIFSAIAEEGGMFICFIIILLFAVILFRGFGHIARQSNAFLKLASAGLLVMLGTQILINLSTVMNLLPTKGATLPFISYGGSSLIGSALTLGLVLAFTRKRRNRAFAESSLERS